MIKTCNVSGIDIVVTDLSMPLITTNMLKRHVENGAVLYKVIEEPLFFTNDIKEDLLQSMMAMRATLASPVQMVLLITVGTDIRKPDFIEVQRFWNVIGGVSYVVEDADSFFREADKNEDRPPRLKDYFIWLIPGGIKYESHDIDGMSVIGAMQELVTNNPDAREFLEIPEVYDVTNFNLLERNSNE